ncbi:MAG: DUF4040 domain-containing protein [Wolbachia endosymbiont of Xenopsylla cheopis]
MIKVINMIEAISCILLSILIVTALAVSFVQNLIINTLLMSIFSIAMALIYLLLNAPDVAITESCVGAGISTIFTLAALSLIKNYNAKGSDKKLLSLCVVLPFFFCFMYIMLNIPSFGNTDAPIHKHVAPYYIENTSSLIGIPNIVTAILASFRGYDTLCETVVVLIAAIGISLILKKNEKHND